ncbi:hypothetical protein [Parvularcula oceani]|uniref:hypothetical protein n=1 Tax=Parvularcula oceani TaxID=1247963 RepID=UPI00055E80C8|nr:hypothetical protein [Parvularcula oceani]
MKRTRKRYGASNGVGQLLSSAMNDNLPALPSGGSPLVWTPGAAGVQNGATAYAANTLNQYTSVRSASPAYDANGNLTADGELSGKFFAYNAEIRLFRVREGSSSGPVVATYLHYADGNRRYKDVAGGAKTAFFHTGD